MKQIKATITVGGTRIMDDDTIMTMIASSIMTAYDHAALAFKNNPSTENWTYLLDCMWARQALTSRHTMDRALPELKGAGIGRWISMLREIHETS